jgi:hypothetical protein
LTSTTFCQPSSGVSSGRAPQDVPALLTRTSMRAELVRARGRRPPGPARNADVAAHADRRHAEPAQLLGDLLAALGLARAEDEVGAHLGQRLAICRPMPCRRR